MAFEQVFLRLPDGHQFGPVSIVQLGQWWTEGRVPRNALVVDDKTGAVRRVSDFPGLVESSPVSIPQNMAPPPVIAPQYMTPPTAADHRIPTRNLYALIGYYVGMAGIIFGPLLGIAAIILGIIGFHEYPRVGVGKKHAITAIVLGMVSFPLHIAFAVFLSRL
jgi:hypothetical protein